MKNETNVRTTMLEKVIIIAVCILLCIGVIAYFSTTKCSEANAENIDTTKETVLNFEGEDADLSLFEDDDSSNIVIQFGNMENTKSGYVKFFNKSSDVLENDLDEASLNFEFDFEIGYEELLAYENPFSTVSSTYYKDKLKEMKGEKFVALYNAILLYNVEGYEYFIFDKEYYGVDEYVIFDIYDCVAGDIPLIDSSKHTLSYKYDNNVWVYSVHLAKKSTQMKWIYKTLIKDAEEFKDLNGLELALAVNNHIAEKLEYDDEYVNDIVFEESELFHAVGNNRAVCDGYASYFQALVLAASDEFDCITVSTASEEKDKIGHEYVLMTIDASGTYYAFDPTNNDALKDPFAYFATSIDKINNSTPSKFISQLIPKTPATVIEQKFSWSVPELNENLTYDPSFNGNLLNYARNTEYITSEGAYDYAKYVYDPINTAIIKKTADKFRDFANENGYNEEQLISIVISFVQNFTYEYDSDFIGEEEYVKFPFETLIDGKGDCEDTALLLASLFKELGFNSGFVIYPDHMLALLDITITEEGRRFFEINEGTYFIIETTNPGWAIGQVDVNYTTAPISITVLEA